jgi:hypothetical protein
MEVIAMWIEVIKPYVEHLGAKGSRRDIPAEEGRIHVLLGNVIELKKSSDIEFDEPPPRKKRAYRRRDLRAEE